MDKHRKHNRLVVVAVAAAFVAALTAPASAATDTDSQTLDATLAESITMSLSNPVIGETGDEWVLAANSATNNKAAGNLTVSTNGATFSVTVLGEKAKLSQWDPTLNTGAGGYVAGGATLGAPTVITATNEAGVAFPGATVDATAPGAVVPAGTGIDLSGITPDATNVYGLSLNQPTTFVDRALPAGHTYHNVLTYTATSAL